MLERDRNYSAPSSSSASSNNEGNEQESLSISEPGPSATVEPKSAIDVALELIAQEELEAINAARMNPASTNAKTDSDMRPSVKRKETQRS
ncbi:hypothetical protein OSTOST_04505, partial [Ostertagia ostertagi]